jgi:hypothetical protein
MPGKTHAEILSATVESLVNRSEVAFDRIRALAAGVGPHAIEPYTEHGEHFAAFRFADGSRVDYSPDDPNAEALDSPDFRPRTLSALLDRAAADISRLPDAQRESDHGELIAELRTLADALRGDSGEEWTPPAATTTQRALDADMVNADRARERDGRIFRALVAERHPDARVDPARFAVDGTTETGEYDGGTDRPPYAVHDAARQTWIAAGLPERWQAEAIAAAARQRADAENRVIR